MEPPHPDAGDIRMPWVAMTKWTIGLALACGVLGAGLAAVRPSTYSATAELVISVTVPGGTGNVSPEAADRTVQTAIAVLDSPRVERLVTAQLRREAGEMSASQISNTNVVALTATGDTAFHAAELANAYSKAYILVRRQQTDGRQRQLADAVRVETKELDRQVSALTADLIKLKRDRPTSGQIPVLSAERSELLRRKSALEQQIDQGRVDTNVVSDTILSTARPPAGANARPFARYAVAGGVVGAMLGLGLALLFAPTSVPGPVVRRTDPPNESGLAPS